MLIPSVTRPMSSPCSSLSRRVNANSQQIEVEDAEDGKLIKKGEC